MVNSEEAQLSVNGNIQSLAMFSAAAIVSSDLDVQKTFSSDGSFQLNINKPIYSLTIDADISMLSLNSLVRVLLLDENENEYLLLEAYPLIMGEGSVSVNGICEETCALSGIVPASLKIQVIDSTLKVNHVSYTESENELNANAQALGALEYMQGLRSEQNDHKIRKLNEKIADEGMIWTAGDTEVSRLSYEEKKRLFANPLEELPNLQGFEYYKSGIFNIGIQEPGALAASDFPASWDWRDRHGENWVTSVKNQGNCASCWAYATLAATEGVINVYYNQHLDIDISEQDSVCRHGGSCYQGGYLEWPFAEMKASGLVDEDCYPTTNNEYCPSKCADSSSRLWKITNYEALAVDDDSLKRKLIEAGPITFGIKSWWHFMNLVGYDTDGSGQTVWIVKNSWGLSWGQSGFGRVTVSTSDRYGTASLTQPYLATDPNQYLINCEDNDNDGYCNWGITVVMPDTCPATCNAAKDCDDSDPATGGYDEQYNCISITPGCGNGICGEDESCELCPIDCGNCEGEVTFEITQISPNGASQTRPNMYGNKIVWMDFRNGQDIYLYDFSTGEEFLVSSDSTNDGYPYIYGNNVVWEGVVPASDDTNVYLYNLNTGQQTMLTADVQDQKEPVIYGNKVVWRDYRLGNWDIYLYDISTQQETQITDDTNSQWFVSMQGDRIAWYDFTGVYVYDIITEEKRRISSSGLRPVVFENKIAYIKDSNIYVFDLLSGQEVLLGPGSNPGIFGEKVVWINNYVVYLYDFSTEQQTQITPDNGARRYSVIIYENKILWQEYTIEAGTNIFMATLDEESNGYCGDGFCNGDETCTTCTADCGPCSYTKLISEEPSAYNPAVSGDIIVYRELGGSYRPWDSRIRFYDISTGEYTTVFEDIEDQEYPDISGDKIVWRRSIDGVPPQLYIYDISTQEMSKLTDGSWTQNPPAISGNRVVWSDARDSPTGRHDIFMKDISTGTETRITLQSESQLDPDISGDKIVFRGNRNSQWNIFLYDISTGVETQITTGTHSKGHVRIFGDIIVWEDNRAGNYDIYVYDISTGEEYAITQDLWDQKAPSVSGNSVVYHDAHYSVWQIYKYDLDTGQNVRLTSHQFSAGNPVISDNKVVYEYPYSQDIYLHVFGIESNCGNGACEEGETLLTCPLDCGAGGDCESCDGSCIIDGTVSGSLSGIEIGSTTISPEAGLPGTLFTLKTAVTDVMEISSVIAVIDSSKGNISFNMTLYDDGLHDDENAGDGIYANVLNSTYLAEHIYTIGLQVTNAIAQTKQFSKLINFTVQTFNIRDSAKFAGRTAFLISDKDWKNVLPLVPVAIWTENNTVYNNPLLIYHEEDFEYYTGFDMDSIVHFMQQYGTEAVIISGDTPQELDDLLTAAPELGAGIPESKILRITPEDYLSAWQEYLKVVYVEDNYKLAIIASTYASLINSPLIIQGTPSDTANVFLGRDVICVGDVEPSGTVCSEQYTLEALQQKYVDLTGTKKVLVVNPQDWNYFTVGDYVFPTRSAGRLDDPYIKMSLAGPILASAKHEVMIFVDYTSVTKEQADDAIEESYDRLMNIMAYLENEVLSREHYLTIVANADAIPIKSTMSGYGVANDPYYYANFESPTGGYPEINIGRMFGITISDVASQMARSIFYDEIKDTDRATFMVTSTFESVPEEYIPNIVEEWSQKFDEVRSEVVLDKKIGYLSAAFDPDLWLNNDVISYNDHGSAAWAGISSSEIPSLSNSIVFNYACSTCSTQYFSSFCTKAIRQGAIAHLGAISLAYSGTSTYRDTMNNLYYREWPLGEAFVLAYRWAIITAPYTAKMITLLGDPTLEMGPKLNNKLLNSW
ncbi:MAG: C1 family peptidase [Nanoarchaeota archaeon]